MRGDWTAPAAMTAVVDDEAVIVVDMARTPDLSADEGAEIGALENVVCVLDTAGTEAVGDHCGRATELPLRMER